ncbi:hypothetical protein CspeluHIS016_0306600 [Cutaneotrichosporon spelunceum]|uniref:Uncharacterized protein n=1 Tax=Cutaneotrichosporon spelunceum TaxID=1672016 RepID=A0AAD3TTW1_9TREE|nr:hypothetical protein CspeluHIS016_0306600 [Cutaneotrichosporon spelunceum]
MLDLSRTCAVVRSFDDVQGYRLGPALLSPLRSPIDLWTPPPSPQASVTGLFPHRASLYVSNWTAGSLMDGAVPPPSAGLVSNWRVHTAMRMERHVARSVRMSTLSNQLNKLELQHSTHAFERDEPQFLDSPLSRLPNLSEIETNFDTSALHTVSQKSLATRPSFESSLETLQSDALEDGILTPIFGVLPKDPLDALDALEALAELQPVGYIASGKKHVDAIEALLGLQRPHDVHPFRTDQKRSQLYAESEWYEVPPPLPPKDTE